MSTKTKTKHSTTNLDAAAGSDIPGTLRLNTRDRDALQMALLEHAFGKMKTAREATENALARRVYELSYTAEQRAWMGQAPEGALPTSREINVYLNGQLHTLHFYQPVGADGCKTYDELRVFYKYQSTWDRAGILMISAVEGNGSAGEKLKLAKDIETFLQDVRGKDEQFRSASRQLHETLKAFASWRNLIAEWPEAEPIVRAVLIKRGYEPTRKATSLPMVQLSAMNKLLDLPPEANV